MLKREIYALFILIVLLCRSQIINGENTEHSCYLMGPTPSFIVKLKPLSHDPRNKLSNIAVIQKLSQIPNVTFTNIKSMSGGANILHFTPNTETLFKSSKTTGCYPKEEIDKIIRLIKERVHASYVDPNLLLPIPKTAFPLAKNQSNSVNWNIEQINANKAWQLGEEGDPNIVIAVIDTGILNNLDLNSNIIRKNPVAFVNNGNAYFGTGVDLPTCPSFLCGAAFHGTMVAGVIANTKDENYGESVPGAAPKLHVLPVNSFSFFTAPNCGGRQFCLLNYTSDLINSINWIAGKYMPSITNFPHPAKNINIINMSLGAVSACPTALQAAIDNAHAAKMLVVAAAGNSNTLANAYPGNCKHVISVAATASLGQRASYSNYNEAAQGNILLAGPGGNSPNPTASPPVPGLRVATENGYISIAGGTSAAAPAVAGIAGLLYSYFPDLTPDEVTTLLSDTVSPFPSYRDYTYDCNNPNRSCGKGIVNAVGALTELQEKVVRFRPPTATAMQLSNKLSPLQYCKPGYFVPTRQIIAQQEGKVNARWSIISDKSIGCRTKCEPLSMYNSPILRSRESNGNAIAEYGSICYELHSDTVDCGLINAPGQTVAAGCFK